jgi:hypothetical protein
MNVYHLCNKKNRPKYFKGELQKQNGEIEANMGTVEWHRVGG